MTDEGKATGTLPGNVKLSFVYNGSPNVTASLTIYSHGGTLRAQGRSKLSSPTSPTPSFAGTLTVTGGTGRYAHAHGSGKLYGVFYRRTYAMTVQAQGAVVY